jgi:hypothetical protein
MRAQCEVGRTSPFEVLIKCNDLAFCSSCNFVGEGEEAPYTLGSDSRNINEGKALYTKKNSTSVFTFDRRQ